MNSQPSSPTKEHESPTMSSGKIILTAVAIILLGAAGVALFTIFSSEGADVTSSGGDGGSSSTGTGANTSEDKYNKGIKDGVNVFPIVKVPIEDYNYGDDFNDILAIPKKLNTMYLTDRTPGDPNGLDHGIIVFEKEAFMKRIQFTFYENTLETQRPNRVIILDRNANFLDREILILTKFPATKKDFAHTIDEGKYIFVMLSQ